VNLHLGKAILHIQNSTTLEFIKLMMKFKGSNLDEQEKKKKKVCNRVEIQLSTTFYAQSICMQINS